jgi:hypothetical protein
MGFLYGRAGRLTAKHGGLRPGQFDVAYADGDAGERVPRSRVRATKKVEWSRVRLEELRSREGEWLDGRVARARADGTARLSAKAARAAREAEAQDSSSESSDLSIDEDEDEDEDEAGAVRKPNRKRKPRVECEAAAAGEEQEEEQVRTYVRVP